MLVGGVLLQPRGTSHKADKGAQGRVLLNPLLPPQSDQSTINQATRHPAVVSAKNNESKAASKGENDANTLPHLPGFQTLHPRASPSLLHSHEVGSPYPAAILGPKH